MYYLSNELYHHGILGQKWGIRRFQNKDGTRTEAGKIHYKQIQDDVKNKIEANETEVSSIISQGKAIADMANKLGEQYTKAFSSFKMTPQSKEKMWESLHKDFGNGVDDSELFEWAVEEHVYSDVLSMLPKTVQESRKKYEEAQNAYWDRVENFAKDLSDKYKGTTVDEIGGNSYSKDGERITKNLLYKNLETDWPSYLSRHFDDYWVYDTPEFNSLIEKVQKDFSITEYNKRYGQ